ncbi:MAG: cytochrome c3 family protein [Desulfobacteraceae bacterium]|nr:cytochrome c3 family protein [Desulfobacteraceae bacterium]
MTTKKQLKLAVLVAIHLLLIGIVCYAAFPVKAPDEPIRIMLENKGGKVLFDHQTHTAADGYGISCDDCHHHGEEDEDDKRACRYCHQEPPEGQAYSENCLECHDEEDIDEDFEEIGIKKAFHQQCAGCHEEFEAGPLTNDCSKCHVLLN